MARPVDPMDAPPPPPRVRVNAVVAARAVPRAPRRRPAVAAPPRAPRSAFGQPWVIVGVSAGFASTVLGFLATSLVG